MAVIRNLRILAALAAVLSPLVWVSQAGATELVEFEQKAATAANGPIPPVPAKPLEEAKTVCGSETATFGSELFNTSPSLVKVKYEWADIVKSKEMMVSGLVHKVEFSAFDLPFDHPFSADLTFDVKLDKPYWSLARELQAPGGGSSHELHMELEVGALLHAPPQRAGPLEGEPWALLPSEPAVPTLNGQAHEGLEAAYMPKNGDRIAARGRWIIDCGHNDFHAELHPITFMAFGHEAGSKTVVHVLANGYHVTELYGFGPTEVNASSPKGSPFPKAFEEAVTTFAEKSVFTTSPVHLALLGGADRTRPSTTPWTVCAPPGEREAGGERGKHVRIATKFVKREGVSITATNPEDTRCARITTLVGAPNGIDWGSYTALQPRVRQCDMPWPWLNVRLAEALGVTGVLSNEVERITVNATGGTYTITYGGHTTVPIKYNATASAVQGALNALGSLKPGDITVTGGPGGAEGGTPYTLTYGGKLAGMAITQPTTNRSLLTGGVKLATIVTTSPGGPLDLRRFILSLIEVKVKATLEGFEEKGTFVGANARIKTNIYRTPHTSCLDPLSGPHVTSLGQVTDQKQPFPYYGEVLVEGKD